jgi:hypothetical protein
MQSFFQKSHYHFFIVQIESVIEFNLSACNVIKDVVQEHLTDLYEQSQKN